MNRTTMRAAAPAALVLTLGLGLSACGASNEGGSTGSGDSSLSGTLNGAGSSAQEAAVGAWQAGFQSANSDVTVNYDPAGSGAGREQFIAGGVDFAGSDAYLEDDELTQAQERCGGAVVEVPTYVSPIAVIYNLDGVDDLNLSAETIGAIFEGDITKWNDDAIAADNPDADLPDTDITPVHRSDDSGTTKNFTAYLDAASGGSWSGGEVETWPIKSGEAAQGTSGVVQAVTNGQGTIGYADESQAGDLGKANIKVGEEYTEVTPEAAAKVLDTATQVEGRDPADIALDIDRETEESGVYPIVLVSYMIGCETYDDAAKADLVKGWLEYVTSEDGQQEAADQAGSAPLSADFSAKVAEAVGTIKAAS